MKLLFKVTSVAPAKSQASLVTTVRRWLVEMGHALAMVGLAVLFLYCHHRNEQAAQPSLTLARFHLEQARAQRLAYYEDMERTQEAQLRQYIRQMELVVARLEAQEKARAK